MKMSLTSSNGFEHPSIKSSSFRPKLFCSTLDKEFGPAIRPGHVIEVVGEAGSGKTQFGLHLSARAVAQELRVEDVNNDVKETSDRRVLYISTEGQFPIGRLRQMIEKMGLSKQLMDKIFIENITTIEELMQCLENKIYHLTKQVNVGLVVIDSIAAPIRSEFEMKDSRERTLAIHKVSSTLNMLARKLNSPIVLLNQVTATIDNANQTFGRNHSPCFGLALANYVHTRIYLTRTDLVVKDSFTSSNSGVKESVKKIQPDTRLRTATIDFSPLLPSSNPIHFVIDETGPRGVDIK